MGLQGLTRCQNDHSEKDLERVKGVVDNMCLSVLVRLRKSFWDDTRNGTGAEKLQFFMMQLKVTTVRCRITTLDLPLCTMKGQDVGVLSSVQD